MDNNEFDEFQNDLIQCPEPNDKSLMIPTQMLSKQKLLVLAICIQQYRAVTRESSKVDIENINTLFEEVRRHTRHFEVPMTDGTTPAEARPTAWLAQAKCL